MSFFRQIAVVMFCFLGGVLPCGAAPAGEGADPHATGCVPPNAEQREWERQHMIITRRVRLNQLGLKRALLFSLIGCGLAALLAVGLLFFHESSDHSGRSGRVEPGTSRELAGSGSERPAAAPGRGAGALPGDAGIGKETISAEAVQSRVAELKDTSRPLADREAVVASLGRQGDAGSVAVLMALGSERAYLNAAALKALGSVRNESLAPRICEYLSARLASDESTLACESARSLARLKGAAAVPELAAALARNRQRADGHQEMVCAAIVKALEEIGSPAAVPALCAELARSEVQGWSLEYGSKLVHALQQIRTPAGDAAMLAYAGRLEARKPADPLAGAYYAAKIAEARETTNAAPGAEPGRPTAP